jgi:RNA polymerase sigma-70 factor (ECF subfamily)
MTEPSEAKIGRNNCSIIASKSDTGTGLSTSTLQAIRNGEEEVWASLHTRLEGSLKRIASQRLFRDLRSRIAPSDIVQETFLLAHRSAAGFRGANIGDIVAWLHRILSNRLKRVIRDQKHTGKRAVSREISWDDLRRPTNVADSNSTPSQVAQANEERALLDLAFQTLSLADRQLITDHYIIGMSFADLAERSGRTELAVRKHWSRALVRWRDSTKSSIKNPSRLGAGGYSCFICE